jgi:hypothetical protein
MSVTARRFLLGQLSTDETEVFEERLLQDDELVAETDAVRAELYDEYVRGELSAGERSAFAQRFGSEADKLVFAQALSTRSSDRWRSTIRNTLPIAASIVILVSVTLLLLRPQQPAVAPPPIPRATLTPPASATSTTTPAPTTTSTIAKARNVAILTIALATTRDDATSPSLVLGRDLDDVELRIRIHPADRFDRYAVDLTTAAGAAVWNGPATRDASAPELTATIPASKLKPGEHQIAVFGIADDGAHEELGYQTLVVRAP